MQARCAGLGGRDGGGENALQCALVRCGVNLPRPSVPLHTPHKLHLPRCTLMCPAAVRSHGLPCCSALSWAALHCALLIKSNGTPYADVPCSALSSTTFQRWCRVTSSGRPWRLPSGATSWWVGGVEEVGGGVDWGRRGSASAGVGACLVAAARSGMLVGGGMLVGPCKSAFPHSYIKGPHRHPLNQPYIPAFPHHSYDNGSHTLTPSQPHMHIYAGLCVRQVGALLRGLRPSVCGPGGHAPARLHNQVYLRGMGEAHR